MRNKNTKYTGEVTEEARIVSKVVLTIQEVTSQEGYPVRALFGKVETIEGKKKGNVNFILSMASNKSLSKVIDALVLQALQEKDKDTKKKLKEKKKLAKESK